ncbi:methylmalonyl-CoA decarboxylase [Candidatus Sulfidibacterium hydrothermale]|uniref:methylmalonyl-CoA decarboxylase n=1 Tax=Candidatus Sulfidibacterium hydrothermale TaxID=2875962 RepID=UPI001F0A3557|nr:methylmalonyl-CoA decarboxylase [Candidatus Sulfidibacterium hydrothermale]UBM61564.1 methylmalonyl-CoA decarboxylase [Candidatus Sulfidibacterium hydrothermale]
MQFIQTEQKERLGTLWLDNDAKSNSLNLTMIDEMTEAFDAFEKNRAGVVVLRSNPQAKVWCAGLRIDQLPSPGKDPVPYAYSLEKILTAIENFSGVVIAMIDGSVWGGGCELAFACDILVGGPRASFAITPAKIGAPYNPNQVNRVLQRVGSNIAMELFFTADVMPAERAAHLGILNHLVASEKLETFTLNMASKILNNAPLAISLIKKQVRQLATRTVEQVTQDEENREAVKRVYFSRDFEEGKKAFLEKRKPVFKGK